ncbi:protein kinase domain-containing protein [Nocardioides solisilvae]|uniref:protein kinase domain-containing protein n=1 Tax=Nocardioides solisilvae TaxID=1542435 RepID=UPI000D74B70D|nr:protein kinase [Nocardioides solisilvae]
MSDHDEPGTQALGPGAEGPGRWVDDAHRYRLESRIATGGMGEVWRAADTVLGRTVAVKLLKAEYADDATLRSRFETEARHAAALSHAGIAAVYDFGEAGAADGSGAPRPYLVMELVEGQPLSALLRSGTPLDPEATRELLAQVGDALGAAHRAGIVHRDVKPANLLVTPDRRVKVTDFGIARAAEGMALTQTGQVMGTPQYLSPEQAEGGRATPASDVYSLGVVAFECLAGRRPFEADSPVATALAHLRQPVPELPGDVPAPLAAVVRRALAKKPEDRFADGAALAAALRDPAAHAAPVPVPVDEPVTTVLAPPAPEPATGVLPATGALAAGHPATGALPTQPPDERRSAWPLAVAGVVLLALLAAGAWWVLAGGGDADDEPARDRPTRSQRPAPSQEPSDEPVQVRASDYVGRDVDQVVRELRRLGLEVVRDERDNPGDEREGEVVSVNPTGALVRGDRVTVAFWGAAPEEEPTEEPSEEPTPTPTPEPTPTPPPTPEPTPTPTPTPEPTPPPEATPTPEPPAPSPEGTAGPDGTTSTPTSTTPTETPTTFTATTTARGDR